MKTKALIILFLGLFALISANFVSTIPQTTPLPFTVPKGWPKPVYSFDKNPPTKEGFQLGRYLFYDPLLSRDNTISCASCHLQATGFTHVDHDLSHGIDGKIGNRNSMTIMNTAWNKSFMWDGAVNHLDVQALAPITNPLEMDETLQNVLVKLNGSTIYKTLFYRAFGDSTATGERTLKAIAQFMVQLNSSNSRYDKYVRNEPNSSFSAQEKNGLRLFETFCVSCHPAPLFTNNKIENNGLPVDSTLFDFGRFNVTKRVEDSFQFKVPTLRNIQFSGPYMHDGRFTKLSEVIEHYRHGIIRYNNLSPALKTKIIISDNDKVDLISFLYTLSDTSFLFNPKYAYPKNIDLNSN